MKKIVDDIFEIEKDLALFSKQINGIYFWKLVRFNIWNKLVENQKLYEKPKGNGANNVELIKKIAINSKKNIRYKKETVNTLFFISNRLKKYNKKNKEIYISDIWEKESERKQCVHSDNIQDFFTQNIWYENDIEYAIRFLLNRVTKKYTLNSEEIDIIEKINKFFYERYQVKQVVTIEELSKLIQIFLFKKDYYKKLLNEKKVEKIYLICSYGKEHIIAAARENNIKTIELQHGLMDEYHLGYHFPNQNSQISYFPDEIYLFGKFWDDITILPNNTTKYIYGYPHLISQLENLKKIEEKKGQILFASQYHVATEFTKEVVNYAKRNPKNHIILRLHPREFATWQTDYPYLNENKQLPNLEISDNNEKTLHELIQESEYIVGISSTVLYEALELRKKVGAVAYPSIEKISHMIEKGYIIQFKNFDSLQLSELDREFDFEKGYIFSDQYQKGLIKL